MKGDLEKYKVVEEKGAKGGEEEEEDEVDEVGKEEEDWCLCNYSWQQTMAREDDTVITGECTLRHA